MLVPDQAYSNLHWWSVFFPKAVAHIYTECMHCNLCCGGRGGGGGGGSGGWP